MLTTNDLRTLTELEKRVIKDQSKQLRKLAKELSTIDGNCVIDNLPRKRYVAKKMLDDVLKEMKYLTSTLNTLNSLLEKQEVNTPISR